MSESANNAKVSRWSRAQYRVFAVVTNPKHFGKTKEEQYKLAKVSRSQFYQILAGPEFREAVHQQILARLSCTSTRILDAAVQSAALPGRDGHNDRRMLLTMAGLYSDKRSVEHSGKVVHELELGDRLAQAAARREKLGQEAQDSEGALMIEGEAAATGVGEIVWEN